VAGWNGFERFADLLDPCDDDNTFEEETALSLPGLPRTMSNQSFDGWNTECSVELQRVADSFIKGDLYNLEFSVTVADPSVQDCPLVACSIGFTDLTGYCVHEIVGRNCRFLLNGVPSDLVAEQTRNRCRSFCQSVKEGREYDGGSEVVAPKGFDLLMGELICVQTNATKSGELFRNMFCLKQVELDDKPYILALQAGVPEQYGDESVEEIGQDALRDLASNMITIEHVLASQFWFQAAMRRQDDPMSNEIMMKL